MGGLLGAEGGVLFPLRHGGTRAGAGSDVAHSRIPLGLGGFGGKEAVRVVRVVRGVSFVGLIVFLVVVDDGHCILQHAHERGVHVGTPPTPSCHRSSNLTFESLSSQEEEEAAAEAEAATATTRLAALAARVRQVSSFAATGFNS